MNAVFVNDAGEDVQSKAFRSLFDYKQTLVALETVEANTKLQVNSYKKKAIRRKLKAVSGKWQVASCKWQAVRRKLEAKSKKQKLKIKNEKPKCITLGLFRIHYGVKPYSLNCTRMFFLSILPTLVLGMSVTKLMVLGMAHLLITPWAI